MKIFKTTVITVVLVVILHIVIIFSLSDAKIFPCPIWSSTGDGPSEWIIDMCDMNYNRSEYGSATKLTPGGTAARVGLIYVLPALITAGVIYGLHFRKMT